MTAHEIYKGTPFRYRLRNEFPGRAGKLMRLAHDGRVVRVSLGWNDRDLCDLNAFTVALKRDGIRVPTYDVVRGPRWDRPGKQAMYVITESIIGERLDEIAAPGELDLQLPLSRSFYKRFYDKLDDFVSALFNHYLTVLEHGGLVFKAMDESQFLYGTTRTDRQPYIYFVDLDPTYSPVPAMNVRVPGANANESKAEFEKPINVLFEMHIRHPRAGLEHSLALAKQYFATCSALMDDFYGPNAPWWARPPNFEQYQRMKTQLLGM